MISDFHIRLATFEDAMEIAEMSKAYVEYGLPWGWRAQRVAKAIEDPATNVVLVREGGILIAFGIMKYADEVAHLLLLAIHTSRRRVGLGSALVAWLEQVARVAGIRTIRVQARQDNTVARAFYSTHGYRETAIVPGMYRGMADGVRLEKNFGDHPARE